MQLRDVMIKGEDYVIDIVAHPERLTPEFYKAVQDLGAFLYSLQTEYLPVRVRVTNLYEGIRVRQVEFPLDSGGYGYIRGHAGSAAVILGCEDFVLTHMRCDAYAPSDYEDARLQLARAIRGEDADVDKFGDWGL